MTPLQSDSENSVLIFLVGLIVLVLLGTAASLLIDRGDIPKPYEASPLTVGEAQLIDLDFELKIAYRETERDRLRAQRAEELKMMGEKLNEFEREAIISEAESVKIQKEIEALQDDWAAYRKERRSRHRVEMLGSTFDQLELPTGRRYENVQVTGITNAGITIKHEHGRARVSVADLSVEMRRQLDLNLDEAEVALAAEEARQRAYLARVAERAGERRKEREIQKRTSAVLDTTRLKMRVDQIVRKRADLLREARIAISNHQTSRLRSGPDGLETWEGRARRMNRLANRYLVQIGAMVEVIKETDPDYHSPLSRR